MTVNISSEGLPFGEFTDAGDYVSRIPDLADLTVVGLSAGDLPFFLFADC